MSFVKYEWNKFERPIRYYNQFRSTNITERASEINQSHIECAPDDILNNNRLGENSYENWKIPTNSPKPF